MCAGAFWDVLSPSFQSFDSKFFLIEKLSKERELSPLLDLDLHFLGVPAGLSCERALNQDPLNTEKKLLASSRPPKVVGSSLQSHFSHTCMCGTSWERNV